MDALVMCGGRGTRLDADVEKPLFEVNGRPMVDRVVGALAASDGVDDVYAAVSPQTPRSREHLAARDAVAVIETPGDGYVADLDVALETVGRPAVTATADLALLAPEHVDRALAARRDAIAGGATGGDECACGEPVAAPDTTTDVAGDATAAEERADASPSLSVCVPVAVKERLGASVDAEFDGLAPTGLNVVGRGGDIMHETDDERLAVNVNRLSDAAVATALLEGDR